MTYLVRVQLHPLGVVVQSERGERELLIDGESYRGLSLADLRRIALTTGRIQIDDNPPPMGSRLPNSL